MLLLVCHFTIKYICLCRQEPGSIVMVCRQLQKMFITFCLCIVDSVIKIINWGFLVLSLYWILKCIIKCQLKCKTNTLSIIWEFKQLIKQTKTVLNKYDGGFRCERTTGDGLFYWRKCYYGLWSCIFARSNGLKLKCHNDGFLTSMQLFA